MANLNGTTSDLKSSFLGVYSVLKSELLNDPAFDFTDDSRQWVDRMLDYNVPGGKLNRGLSVIDSYKLLKEGKELTEDEIFLAGALGWCIEWLQAYFLVLDDIMDNSHTRRGQPCWFKVPKVGMIAVNDGVLLRNHIPRILKKHFREKPYYVDLLDLFNEVEFQTASGQMIDLITTLEGEKDLSKYSLLLPSQTLFAGKLNRGLSVIDSYKLLKEGKELTEDEIFLAGALGWCIEWLQAYFLVLDDIMDNSHTRRGQPCWFKVPKVGMIAVNDGVLLRNHIPRILKKHFREKPYYVDLLDLFNEVEFQTASGQMIDLITTLEGEKDLSKYSLLLHCRIVQYKTAYYSFYLPVACALLMAGENLENHIDVKDILVQMGIYFQVQDDYLDCFGDPETIGKIGTDIEDFKCSWLVVKALECCNEEQKKIGTDIEDFKCSWLVVKALERCNEEQKKVLYEHYGKADSADVAKVKALYNDLDLQSVFTEYESKSYQKLTSFIEAHPSKAVQAVLKSFLGKIYKRQK
ncbi:unnamed protein product [Ilex paraguariensis]|uniref:Farnesyl pyrophosphate synthase n=1 Tax=Ilex paraguariensis TaxID=185542 RepID=A0ABC8U686_9AQUA